jgi:hypothetical protein
MEPFCGTCQNREHCQAPCKEVRKVLNKGNRYFEKPQGDIIICYPGKREEVQVSSLKDYEADQFSSTDVVPWNLGGCQLRQTTVFVEHFFNKISYRELADRMDSSEDTIASMYLRALERIYAVIQVIDSRNEGIKRVRKGKFTDSQKFFLLVCVFGFNRAEVARIFNRDHTHVCERVKEMEKKYAVLFSDSLSNEFPVEEKPITAELTPENIVSLVDHYTKQGLPRKDAFRRIAEGYSKFLNKPVAAKGIGNKFYESRRAPCEPAESAWECMTM